MNVISQTRTASARRPTSSLARVYGWISRAQADARARRSLAELDTRTLRDIGFTRRDLAVLRVAGTVSSGSR